MPKILSSYQDLQNLKQSTQHLSIAQVEWWLMKYYELYKQIQETNRQYCTKCVNALNKGLPKDCLLNPDYCVKADANLKFTGFYETLDDLTQIHRLSEKCYMAYDDYFFLICANEDCRDWTIKYYHLWERLHLFYFNYVEEESNALSPVKIPNTDNEVTISKDDFKFIIKFYESYYEAYYTKDLYPEKRLEIEAKINNNEN